MIDLYAQTTPNVLKVTLMLEECGLEYRMVPIDVWKGEQFAPGFVALNPNSKVPVIVDHDGPGGPVTVFESIAILFYLAEKTGRMLPANGPARYAAMQWAVFQAANLGPANGQFNHFMLFAPENQEYGLSRYRTELKRVYGVLEARLSQTPFVGGDEFTIADMAVFAWVWWNGNRWGAKVPFLAVGASPAIAGWYARCMERPGVRRAVQVHETLKSGLPHASEDDKDRMFGRGRYAHRTEG